MTRTPMTTFMFTWHCNDADAFDNVHVCVALHDANEDARLRPIRTFCCLCACVFHVCGFRPYFHRFSCCGRCGVVCCGRCGCGCGRCGCGVVCGVCVVCVGGGVVWVVPDRLFAGPPRIALFFSLSPPLFSFFLPLLGVLSLNFGGVLKRQETQMSQRTKALLTTISRRLPVPMKPFAREFIEHNQEDQVAFDGELL